MRNAFIEALAGMARKDSGIFLISADVGFSVFEKFRDEFPGQFLNIGISESNMAGVAAGLAMSGKKAYIYTFASFITMRCFEQIRLDICAHNANVKIIGVGGGLSYALDGPTHHATEDIAIMRALPNMTVVCPGDTVEVKLALEATAGQKGPLYLRIGKKGEPAVHQGRPDFRIGKGILVEDGKDLTIIATGNMLQNAVSASKLLGKEGISARVVSMHTVKPLDAGLVLKCAGDTGMIFTLEEHNRIGGLGSAVAEVLAESSPGCFFRRIALPDRFIEEVGTQDYLRELTGLSPEGICRAALDGYKSRKVKKP